MSRQSERAGLCRSGDEPTRPGSTVPGSIARGAGRAGDVVLVEPRRSRSWTASCGQDRGRRGGREPQRKARASGPRRPCCRGRRVSFVDNCREESVSIPNARNFVPFEPPLNRGALRLGPVRMQRITSSVFIPALLLAFYWRDLGPAGRILVILVTTATAYRAFRMGIEFREDRLVVNNFATTPAIESASVRSVQFRKIPRRTMHRLVLTCEGHDDVICEGVSTRRRAFPEISPDPTRDEVRTTRKVEAFLLGTHIVYVPPEGQL